MEEPAPSLYSSNLGNFNTPNSTIDTNNNNDNNSNNDNKPADDNESIPLSMSKSTKLKFVYQNKNITLTTGVVPDKNILLIQAEEEGNFSYLFERKYFLSELIIIDKVFKQYDNLDEAYNGMIVILKNENNLITEINEEKLIMTIHIINLDTSYREKKIELIKKRQSKDIIIENLSQIINQLKTNNTNLENELSEVKKRLEKIEEQLNKKNFIDSNIIKEEKDYEFIIDRLKKVVLEGNNIIVPEKIILLLLYRGTRDGDKAKDFHEKVDQYSNTLIVVKTKKGLRFGGFTCQTWDGKGDKKDTNSFCFSLDKKKIYNYKRGKTSIYTSPESLPFFGNCIFEINDKFLEMGGSCSEDYFYDNQENQCEINGGEEQFEIEEIEVFKVSF